MERALWAETEASRQELWWGAISEADPLPLGELSSDCVPGQPLGYNLTRDPELEPPSEAASGFLDLRKR